MNKLILVLLLAVCLLTAHAAIVKRDAPDTPKAETFDLTKEIDQFKKTIAENFNPDKIKETFTKFGDQMQEGIKNLMPTETPKV